MDYQLPTGPPHATLGVLLIGLTLSSAIYGVTCLQLCRYFRLHCDGDPWILKAAVIVVWILETVNTAFSVRAIQYFAIENRGNQFIIWTVPWMLGVQASFNVFSGTIIQLFFVWRIFIMSGKNYWFTGFIVALSIIQCGMGIAVSILGLGDYPGIRMKFIDAILAPSFALTASADIIICISLCYYLQKRKTGHDATNRLVNNLTVMTINNGIMSSGFSVMALIAIYTWPMSQFATACCFMHGKAYANTMFASLNSRLKTRNKHSTRSHMYSSSSSSGRHPQRTDGRTHSTVASGDHSDVILISREPYTESEPQTLPYDEMVPLRRAVIR